MVMNVYLSRRFSSEHVRLFLDGHLLQKIVGILEQTDKKRESIIRISNLILTYIQIATTDIGRAESAVNKRHPCDGTIIIAIKYSKILPNDQNNSMAIIIVARAVDGRYSSINVDLESFQNDDKNVLMI